MCRIALLFLVVLSSCGSGGEIEKSPFRIVYTYTVQKPSDELKRSFSGSTIPPRALVLSFLVSGKIIERPVELGKTVEIGELLARIDPKDYELELEKARAQLLKAKAHYQQASLDYERDRALYETDNISRSKLEHSWVAFQQSESEWKAAQQSFSIAEQRLGYTNLQSPVDGTVSAVKIELYQTVDRGQPVVQIASGEGFDVSIGVPPSLVPFIRVRTPATVRFPDLPGVELRAIVTKVATASMEGASFIVELHLLDEHSSLRSGVVCNVTLAIPVDETKQVVTVPPEALMRGNSGKPRVWIYDPSTQTVVSREIEIAELTGTGFRVVSGVEVGDQLVVRGIHHLKEGQQVKGRDVIELGRDL